MRYGYFDNEKREYVIDRVDVPVSWTNYIGLGDMYGVFNHTAGGYLVYKSPEYHRVTRFRVLAAGGKAEGALLLPPRAQLCEVQERLRRHRGGADPVRGRGRSGGDMGCARAQRL